tara:strand:- start:256 stop:426 length:171 start_codon:yes stop_codon:yes gene_type:complete
LAEASFRFGFWLSEERAKTLLGVEGEIIGRIGLETGVGALNWFFIGGKFISGGGGR